MRYVIIGSSAAGVNAVRELRKYDQDGEIILVSKDKTYRSASSGQGVPASQTHG